MCFIKWTLRLYLKLCNNIYNISKMLKNSVNVDSINKNVILKQKKATNILWSNFETYY